MVKIKNLFYILSLIVVLSFCSTSSNPKLPNSFNNYQVSLENAVDELQKIKDDYNLIFEFRIVREVTDEDECIDKILGTILIKVLNYKMDYLSTWLLALNKMNLQSLFKTLNTVYI